MTRMRRRRRNISFYIEWAEEEDTGAVAKLLRDMGACIREIDGDVDLEYVPGPVQKHAHTVFRFRADRDIPVFEMLSAVAEHPGVYSVTDMKRRA